MARRTKPQPRKQIYIVEDHPVFCDGLLALFNHDPELHVCGTATNATQALKEIRHLRPDVLVLDIGLPDKSGFELMREVSALKRDIAILVVSAGDEMVQARQALRAGAKGYVMKHEGPERLLQAVHQVLLHNTTVSPQVANQILKSIHRAKGVVDPLELLSPRERQILGLIGDGLPGVGIARQLRISVKTVDAYRANIRQKLGLPDAHELLCYAVRWRLSGTNPRSAGKGPGHSQQL